MLERPGLCGIDGGALHAHVGMVHAEKEGRTTREKEAIATLIEYPRMDMGRQKWCGSASCAREWGQARHSFLHHLPRPLVSNYTHSFVSDVGSPDRQSPPANCACCRRL